MAISLDALNRELSNMLQDEAIAAIARELGVAYEYAVNVYAHRMAASLPTVKREVPTYAADVSFI